MQALAIAGQGGEALECVRPMESPAPSKAHRALLVALGVAVAIAWIGAACLLVVLSFGATLMANDSGSAPQSTHMALILGAFGGQALTALAGLPLGAAVFWAGRRRFLLRLFAGLLALGLAAQLYAAYQFLFSFQP